jgi:type II secretory pathway component PulF
MTTMSRNRANTQGLGILIGIMLVGGIVFFCCYFILPKIDATMKSAGVEPSLPLGLLIQLSNLVIKYFWLIIGTSLVLGFVSARNASSRRSEMPRD